MQSKTVDVHWLRPGIMEFIYRGEVLAADLAAGVRHYNDLSKAKVPLAQVVDTLGVISVPPELRTELGPLLDGYRDRGGRHVVMIAGAAFTAMLGRSMSFGAGLKLSVFDNRKDALAFVEQLVAEAT
jgi:hypothetical protein